MKLDLTQTSIQATFLGEIRPPHLSRHRFHTGKKELLNDPDPDPKKGKKNNNLKGNLVVNKYILNHSLAEKQTGGYIDPSIRSDLPIDFSLFP